MSLQILVVDDDVDSGRILGWLLESMGYLNFTLAHDGLQALQAAEALLPDVILLDIGLPGLNGYEVCRQLRSNPQLAQTLIIAQSGWGEARDREMAYFAGFDHHLAKPVPPEQLATLLAKVVPRTRVTKAALRGQSARLRARPYADVLSPCASEQVHDRE
ncbi:MAG: response regulator [Pseudomonadota bacterium]